MSGINIVSVLDVNAYCDCGDPVGTKRLDNPDPGKLNLTVNPCQTCVDRAVAEKVDAALREIVDDQKEESEADNAE